MATINRPVGLRCKNDQGDVMVVQILLNAFIIPGCLGAMAQLMVDGLCGNKTCEAIYRFQMGVMGHKKPDMKIMPGGPTITRLNGPLKWANRPPGDPVVYPSMPSAPEEPIPELRESGWKFETSKGVDLGGGPFVIAGGGLKLKHLDTDKTHWLSYAAVGVGSGPLKASLDFSTVEMPSYGIVYPNVLRQGELTLNDITGWCVIYQGAIGVGMGYYGTLVLLSVGAALIATMIGSATGVGVLLGPAVLLKSCRGVVLFGGANATTQPGVSGAIGYLGYGDAEAKIKALLK